MRLAIAALCVLSCQGCDQSHMASSSEVSACDRYLAIASVYDCIDGEVWGGGRGCPTDEELAARGDGHPTLEDCVTFLESQCASGWTPHCDCLTDTHCRCAIGLGPHRSACAPEPGP